MAQSLVRSSQLLLLSLALMVITPYGHPTRAESTAEVPRAISEDLRIRVPQEAVIGEGKYGTASIQDIANHPSTINVAITGYAHCGDWIDAGQPVIRVDTIDFKTYVKNVLPNEWISSWEPESLKAGAIAAKNYGWRKQAINARGYLKSMHGLSKSPDIVDNTCDQRYIANSDRTSTNQAVDAVWDYRITRDNALLINFYLATKSQCDVSPYQPCMSQWESQFRAQEGKNWQEIISQYYQPVTISRISGSEVGAGESDRDPSLGLTVYRFWSDQILGHFYTTDPSEKQRILTTYDSSVWRYEGISYYTVSQHATHASPVYRFWSDRFQTHFYTSDPKEKNTVAKTYDVNTWRYEGVAFYVYPYKGVANSKPVYRFWSDRYNSHFYTASVSEKNAMDSSLWRYEGIAWWVNK